MQITTILAFITAMGGLEAVKWLVRYITCRKTDARKEEASVNSMEEENRRKKVDWLEERLTQRDEKIDGLYIELRKEQEEKIDWIHKCHEVELIQKESEVKKCEIRGCVKRMPPSDYHPVHCKIPRVSHIRENHSPLLPLPSRARSAPSD